MAAQEYKNISPIWKMTHKTSF